MATVLLIVTIICNVLCNSVKNVFAKKDLKNQSDNLLFTLLTNPVCILIMALGGGLAGAHSETVLLGAVFGLLNLLSTLSATLAFKLGPMSLTSLIVLCGSTLTSTIVNTIWFHEAMPTGVQIAGIVLIILSMVLASNTRLSGNISPFWFPVVIISAVFNGTLGVVQKIQTQSDYPEEMMQFLFWTFIFCTLFNAVMLLFNMNCVKKEKITLHIDKRLAGAAAIVGITTAAMHIINLKLVGLLPSAVFFPILTCGRITLTILVDYVFFHTRLSKRQIISLLMGFIAILMVSGVIH